MNWIIFGLSGIIIILLFKICKLSMRIDKLTETHPQYTNFSYRVRDKGFGYCAEIFTVYKFEFIVLMTSEEHKTVEGARREAEAIVQQLYENLRYEDSRRISEGPDIS